MIYNVLALTWNISNTAIALLATLLLLLAIARWFRAGNSKTMLYLCGFIITSTLTILQVILIDARVVERFPVVSLFYMPYEFAAPILFSAFSCSYLGRMWEFKRYRYALFFPLLLFFVLYTVLKVNVLLSYSLFAKAISQQISAEGIENVAVLFALINGIWNYRMIKDYERERADLSHEQVLKRTHWLRVIYTLLLLLCAAWVLVIIYLKVTRFEHGMMAYYPLWFAFLGFYFAFYVLGVRHLRQRKEERAVLKEEIERVITNFNLQGLNTVFTTSELKDRIVGSHNLTRILSFFATSLYDKTNEEAVLWDIVKNCIGSLDIEDAVIYMFDQKREMLLQKAAYGHKAAGGRKILSPIQIPVGQGIVGQVAATGVWECIADVSKDDRYIVDDLRRQSELAVPICWETKVIGVLDSEHSKKDFFTKRHIFLFQLIAKLTATKLQHLAKKELRPITNDNAYYKELCYLLKNEKHFKDPNVSLLSIANRLHISSTYLSQLVNSVTDSNFSDFINGYRVIEAQRLLTHPNYSNYPIRSVGLEAGFNSKSAFYAAFKKHTGMTPSEYKVNAPFVS